SPHRPRDPIMPPPEKFRIKFFLAAVLVFAAAAGYAYPDSEEEQPDQPKLVVLVVFDQMRGDYPSRWEKLYDKDGFGKLLHEGAWYQNCHYPYSHTVTAAGHASLATGCPPAKHGIVGNYWYDPALGKVESVSSRKWQEVSLLARPLGKVGYVSPENRLRPS